MSNIISVLKGLLREQGKQKCKQIITWGYELKLDSEPEAVRIWVIQMSALFHLGCGWLGSSKRKWNLTCIMNGRSEDREITESEQLCKGLSVWTSTLLRLVKHPFQASEAQSNHKWAEARSQGTIYSGPKLQFSLSVLPFLTYLLLLSLVAQLLQLLTRSGHSLWTSSPLHPSPPNSLGVNITAPSGQRLCSSFLICNNHSNS